MSRGKRQQLARWLTEILAPWVIVLLLPAAVSWALTHELLPTLGWGLIIGLTSSILPMTVIMWGARTGRWEGHHVRNRAGRLVPFLALIVLSAAGLAILVALNGPWPLIALQISMVVSLLITGAITIRWKISMHAAVAAGAVVILAVMLGPWWWLAFAAVAVISWARVKVRDHTLGQVVMGCLIGAVVGGGLFRVLL